MIELADLSSITNAMQNNEQDIKQGIDGLRDAIESLNRVSTVLNAVEKLLALGARIAPLLI